MDCVTLYFSKDRPLQLDLALRTYQKQCEDPENSEQIVLYKASNLRVQKAYKRLSLIHESVKFIEENSFKSNLLSILSNKRYILFCVDDAIFTGTFSIFEMISALNIFRGVMGFSLRLGKNTQYCYPIDRPNSMPMFQDLARNILIYNWVTAGDGDFSYPLEVSSSLYRVEDLMPLLEKYNYVNPNELEWILSYNKNLFTDFAFLMCYDISACFCNPVNKVMSQNTNRAGNNEDYSIESLLTKFEKGGIIRDENFNGFVSNSCHQEVKFEYSFSNSQFLQSG